MMTALGAAPRYAFFYGAVFLVIGIALPFWPLWLESRGLTPAEIGLLLGPAYWIKVVTTPSLAYAADRSGRTKTVLIVLAGISLLAYGGFFWATAFWQIFLLQLLAAATFFALNPLAESMTLAAVTRDNLDYGRIRLWGSLTFILGALGTGALLEGRSSDIILWLIVGAACGALLAAIVFPAAPPQPSRPQAGQLRALLTQGAFLPFLIAAGLLQASHAVYYGFSSLNWEAAGLSKEAIGWLWAEGVIAEILLFALAGKYLSRASPRSLLLWAGLAGVLRWSLLGLTNDLWLLILLQTLHAGTFGLAHLGAMRFIAGRAPDGHRATAQGLYAAISGGLIMGLAIMVSGGLYEHFAGQAYFAMAGISLAGALLAARIGNGGKTTGQAA